ncbi:MAG: hypothetical protein ACLTDR_00195 [Adlercreutzia equolifaciens]
MSTRSLPSARVHLRLREAEDRAARLGLHLLLQRRGQPERHVLRPDGRVQRLPHQGAHGQGLPRHRADRRGAAPSAPAST